jgi:hypothetical protein
MLRVLGADVTIPLDLPPAELVATFKCEIENASVDVVLDYLWGSSAETIIGAVSGHSATARRIRFVQIGSLQSPTRACRPHDKRVAVSTATCIATW